MTRHPLFVIRHGQTDWNAEARLQGQADTDINPHGRGQAKANGRRLAQLVHEPGKWDFVASPLRRTRETMERIRAEMDLDMDAYRTDVRLLELHFGNWQGYTYAEIEAREPGSTSARLASKWDFVPPGDLAENYEMLADRIRWWLGDVTGPSIVVTHGGVVRVLFHILGRTDKHIAADLDVPQDGILRWDGATLGWV